MAHPPRSRKSRYRKPFLVRGPKGNLIPRPQIIVRDILGRYMKLSERYTDRVAGIWSYQETEGRHVEVIAPWQTGVAPTPDLLASLLRVDEYERLPEAVKPIFSLDTGARYAAWDLAKRLDASRGIRRKQLKITMRIRDGRRLRKVDFYSRVSTNQPRSVQFWAQMNEAAGFEKLHFYARHAGRMIADRKGRRVRLEGIDVMEVI